MTFDDQDTAAERHEQRIKNCKSCMARIVWFTTASGKSMPVDADTVEEDDEELDLSRHQSHFASCPNSAKHRRPR